MAVARNLGLGLGILLLTSGCLNPSPPPEDNRFALADYQTCPRTDAQGKPLPCDDIHPFVELQTFSSQGWVCINKSDGWPGGAFSLSVYYHAQTNRVGVRFHRGEQADVFAGGLRLTNGGQAHLYAVTTTSADGFVIFPDTLADPTATIKVDGSVADHHYATNTSTLKNAEKKPLWIFRDGVSSADATVIHRFVEGGATYYFSAGGPLGIKIINAVDFDLEVVLHNWSFQFESTLGSAVELLVDC